MMKRTDQQIWEGFCKLLQGLMDARFEVQVDYSPPDQRRVRWMYPKGDELFLAADRKIQLVRRAMDNFILFRFTTR